MKTVRLTDAELALVRNAVHGYLVTFGHNESDIVLLAKDALARLDAATDEPATEPAN